MTPYLDASALLPMLIDEPGSRAVDAFITQMDQPPVVSDFAAAEVASALSRLARTARLAIDDAMSRLSDFDAWRAAAAAEVEMTAADIRLAAVYVRRFDLMLRTPDALHAAVCRREDLELITLDRRLATSAGALGITVRFLTP